MDDQETNTKDTPARELKNMAIRVEKDLEKLRPPVIEGFLNRNNKIPQDLWDRYKQKRSDITQLYRNVFDWHGTGRFKIDTKTREVVDILEGIVKERGLKPQLDEWNYKAGSGHTVSTTQFRPYATFYSDMFMQKHDPLVFSYGTAHDWGRYIGDKIILGSGGTFVDLLRAGGFRKKFNEWTERRVGEETSFFKLSYKLIRPGGAITSKILGNYPILIGIKNLDHISSENLAPVYANSERRTGKLISLQDITHIEVPDKYVAKTQQTLTKLWEKYALDRENMQMPKVISRELGEIYCSEFMPQNLMTEDVFRNNNNQGWSYNGRFRSKKIRTALEAYHVAGLFTQLGIISTIDGVKSKLFSNSRDKRIFRKKNRHNLLQISLPENDGIKAFYMPYQFSEHDLQKERLMHGVEHTLSQYYKWRDTHPELIEEYVTKCLSQVKQIKSEFTSTARVGRSIRPIAKKNFREKQMMAELLDFGLRNMSEIPDKDRLLHLAAHALQNEKLLQKGLNNGIDIGGFLQQQFPTLKDSPEMEEINRRLQRLYAILPEKVIRNGAMGKVARTILGVATLADFDMIGKTPDEKKERFRQVVYGAFVYGALYAIIDDTFQDMGEYFPKKAQKAYHEIILEGLRTGKPIDIAHLPDHPLSEEVKNLYDLLIKQYPISQYPHLYQAAESLYLSQDRDAKIDLDTKGDLLLTGLYPDLFIKSGLTRVVANILAGRKLDGNFYTRCLNTLFADQLRDDLIDFEEDRKTGRVTPFTYPSEKADTNPLYDLFAYDAYVANTLYPGAEEILARSEAIFLSRYLSLHQESTKRLLDTYCTNTPDVLRDFLVAASNLPRAIVIRLTPVDQKVESTVADKSVGRRQVDADPQTFALDNLKTINDVINHFISFKKIIEPDNEINSIMEYSLEAGGKRLRPALTLMLAESLGVDPRPLTPILIASELFHTASLLLDDLPWQDNSSTRRGKATAHMKYDPVSVELTGISMLLSGMGVIQELTKIYPPQDIPKITAYIADVIQKVCLGQNMDLHMARVDKNEITLDDIVTMYQLKTSTAIEASLVPLMMLEKRPKEEIEHIKQYAHHAGLVFQIKDDILDASSTAEEIGKDVQQDVNKINIVRLYGIEKAQELMDYHLKEAIKHCRALSFNTNLFQGIVSYFAKRKN